MTAAQPPPRRGGWQEVTVGLLAVTFLAWAGVVYTGVRAVNGQLQEWRESTRHELTQIKIDLATVKRDVTAIRNWERAHGVRPHTEAIELLSNHAARLTEIEREQEKLREKHRISP